MKEVSLLPRGMSIHIASYKGGIGYFKNVPAKDIKFNVSYPSNVHVSGTIKNNVKFVNAGDIILNICNAYKKAYKNLKEDTYHDISDLYIEGLWLDSSSMELIIAVGS